MSQIKIYYIYYIYYIYIINIYIFYILYKVSSKSIVSSAVLRCCNQCKNMSCRSHHGFRTEQNPMDHRKCGLEWPWWKTRCRNILKCSCKVNQGMQIHINHKSYTSKLNIYNCIYFTSINSIMVGWGLRCWILYKPAGPPNTATNKLHMPEHLNIGSQLCCGWYGGGVWCTS